MALGPPPQQGEELDILWRYVAELYRHVRALENMKASVTSPYPTSGKLELTDTETVLVIS
jgi:hypothetical protein